MRGRAQGGPAAEGRGTARRKTTPCAWPACWLREADADWRLGEIDRALAAATEALAIYEALGDREGIAIALFNGATARGLRGGALS